MARSITIPEDLYAQLESLARPFLDREPSDVIRQLLESRGEQIASSSRAAVPPVVAANRVRAPGRVNGRVPRERGATVNVDGRVLHADSIRDLYSQVLQHLSSSGAWDRLAALAPYKTSSRRYLLSTKPHHPNGNPFVVPVQHRGLYMEAHKSYQTAIAQLERLLSRCGSQFSYLGA